ncbi:hypothetical protein F3Y22_tig00110387pilonHSYRG00509 [Hibiscus syriacus]|uniref:Rhamnogalacturonan lyase domain-containing protein n=1 Tax=Hibiscus syriacus TaxID=106335 RepID=A0A6A3AV76_HIBSY|nr:hypothetical protein F3Y22_tig00110387pilonHSYRG00509 [Hibiscus syriacus]
MYGVFEREEDFPDAQMYQLRIAFKLKEDKFRFMAVSDTIQRIMPRNEDRDEHRSQTLDFKEAVLLSNPSNPSLKGEMFVSTHYTGTEIDTLYKQGEAWKKLSEEIESWPYNFTGSEDFSHSEQRGQVNGQLLVQTGMYMVRPLMQAKSAFVGLAAPGDAGSWKQKERATNSGLKQTILIQTIRIVGAILDIYREGDLVYTVGTSNYSRDWFFAHVPRKIGNNTNQPTTWQIKYNLQDVNETGTYTLRLALAAASFAEVQVRFNDPNAVRPYFTTKESVTIMP